MASNRRDYKQASRAALERLATAVLEGGDVAAAAAELERQVARPTQDVRQEILSALDLLRRTLPEGSAQIAAVAEVWVGAQALAGTQRSDASRRCEF